MSIVSKPYTFSAGAVIVASEHNSNFDTLYSDYNGNITNANISGSASVAYSKLDLTGSIVNADINASAAIANSKLNLASISQSVTFSGTTLIGSAHQGDILYDNGTTLTRLTPGTSGQFLKTQGASANPVWASVYGTPQNIQVFTSSGTWTKPAGIGQVYVKVWGAGGNGVVGSAGIPGAGGGGGGYSEGLIAVSGNVTVTVGTGGSGTTTSFDGDTTIQATAGSNASGSTGGAGGAGSNGSINLTGETGDNRASDKSGRGGYCPLGGGGVSGGPLATSNGPAGNFPGGGGAGGNASSSAGGTGADGMVIVYY